MRGLDGLGRWLGASSLEAVGRLAIQICATLVLARLLEIEAFGLAALAFTIVGVLQIFVGVPFEEALVQRKVLRRVHLAAALAATLLAAPLFLLGLTVLSEGLSRWMEAPGLAAVLPVAGGLLPLIGVTSVYTALARRLHRFPLVAWANLAGHVAGGALGVVLALLDAGVWSILAWRLGAAAVTMVWLVAGLGGAIRPRASLAPLRDLRGFTLIHLADRLVETLTLAVLHALVNGLLGLSAVGFLNMAMRLVEPIRGAVGGIGHNIAFSFYAKAQGAPERLGQATVTTMSETALITAPAFLGLAAIMPGLLPLAAGEGWEESVAIAQALCLAAVLATPLGFGHSALSALGRPEYGLYSSLVGLAVLVVALMVGASLGPVASGLARFLADGGEALYLLLPLLWRLRITPLAVVGALGPPLAPALVMAAAVWALGHHWAPESAGERLLVLALQLPLGLGLYVLGAGVLVRPRLLRVVGRLRPGGSVDA